MRRKHQEVKEQAVIDRVLLDQRIGRLATTGSDGYPYITPVNYVWWRGSIYFHSSRVGEKLDNIARDSRVCFAVDAPLAYLDSQFDPENPCEVGQFYQSVVIRGRAELVTAPEEKLGALNALMGSHEGRADYQEITEEMKAVSLCEVVAVRVESLTCKASLAQKKSDEDRQRIKAYLRQRDLAGDRETVDQLP